MQPQPRGKVWGKYHLRGVSRWIVFKALGLAQVAKEVSVDRRVQRMVSLGAAHISGLED